MLHRICSSFSLKISSTLREVGKTSELRPPREPVDFIWNYLNRSSLCFKLQIWSFPKSSWANLLATGKTRKINYSLIFTCWYQTDTWTSVSRLKETERLKPNDSRPETCSTIFHNYFLTTLLADSLNWTQHKERLRTLVALLVVIWILRLGGRFAVRSLSWTLCL